MKVDGLPLTLQPGEVPIIYKLFLGREPESSHFDNEHAATERLKYLAAVISSHEFQSRGKNPTGGFTGLDEAQASLSKYKAWAEDTLPLTTSTIALLGDSSTRQDIIENLMSDTVFVRSLVSSSGSTDVLSGYIPRDVRAPLYRDLRAADVSYAYRIFLRRAPDYPADAYTDQNILFRTFVRDIILSYEFDAIRTGHDTSPDQAQPKPGAGFADFESKCWLIETFPLASRTKTLLATAPTLASVVQLIISDPLFCIYLNATPLVMSANHHELNECETEAASRLSIASQFLDISTENTHTLLSLVSNWKSTEVAISKAAFSRFAADSYNEIRRRPAFRASAFQSHYFRQPSGKPPATGRDFDDFIIGCNRSSRRQPHPLINLDFMVKESPEKVSRLAAYLSCAAGGWTYSIHPLVDLQFILSANSTQGWAANDVFNMVLRDEPLPINPHPLFDVRYYRGVNSSPCRNELMHYVCAQDGSLRTHPLVSPKYLSAAGLESVQNETFLETYAANAALSPPPSIFADPPFINHNLVSASVSTIANPLVDAIRLQLDQTLLFHREVDSRILRWAFSNLVESTSVAALLGAALTIPCVASCSAPAISIIIVTYFKQTYTALAIMAAINAFNGIDHEIIIIENGGEGLEHEELRRLFSPYHNVSFHKLPRNRFFGEGNNIGIDIAKGEYVIFLNNDCFLAPDFGSVLLGILGRDNKISVVAGTLFFPDGRIQEYGGEVLPDGTTIQLYKGFPASALNQLPDEGVASYASAACFCLSRAALDQVVGFDPYFEPFYFEDTDLCKRLARAGYAITTSKFLTAMHVENASTREFLGVHFNEQIDRNRSKFVRRWFYGEGEGGLQLRPRSKPLGLRKKAIVFTPFDIALGGGEKYLLSAAAALAEDYDVTICSPLLISTARIKFVAEELGVGQFDFRTCDVNHLFDDRRRYDVSFVMSNEIIPPICGLADRNILHVQFPFPWRGLRTMDFELVRSYEKVVVNSDFTAAWTRARFEEAGVRSPPRVVVVHPPVSCAPPRVTPRQGPLSIINVGRFFVGGHSKRQDIFIDVIKRVRRSIDCKATLIGGVHDSDDARAFYARVEREARASDISLIREASRQELIDAMMGSDVYLHTGGFGVDAHLHPERLEHFGISIVEAMAVGVMPIVVDGGGPAEIVRKSGVGRVFSDIEEAVEIITTYDRLGGTAARDWALSCSYDSFKVKIRELARAPA